MTVIVDRFTSSSEDQKLSRTRDLIRHSVCASRAAKLAKKTLYCAHATIKEEKACSYTEPG